MKKIAIALLLLAGPAFADDASKPTETTPPVSATAPAPPQSPAPAAPVASPKQTFTEWTLDVDQSDLATLNTCVMELPKKVADPFIAKINGKLKPVK